MCADHCTLPPATPLFKYTNISACPPSWIFQQQKPAPLAPMLSPDIENLLFTLLDTKNLWFIAAIALCACLWLRAHAHIPMPKEHWLYCNFRLFMHACANHPKLSLNHRTLLAICHFQIFWQYRKLRTGHLFIMISSAWASPLSAFLPSLYF